ncbi:MAG: ethanolamine utilization protein EutN [Clostridiaceae bacterium]|nr:ethanolamine utilization protein EutN [Clostridiaceae bacterium]
MDIGKVVGTVVSTNKDPNLKGIKLLVVQEIVNGEPGILIVSADGTRQAGPGDFVYLISKKEAGLPFPECRLFPSDSSIVGFIDRINK